MLRFHADIRGKRLALQQRARSGPSPVPALPSGSPTRSQSPASISQKRGLSYLRSLPTIRRSGSASSFLSTHYSASPSPALSIASEVSSGTHSTPPSKTPAELEAEALKNDGVLVDSEILRYKSLETSDLGEVDIITFWDVRNF